MLTFTSKIKQYLLVAGAAILAIGVFALKMFNAGVSSEKTKQTQTSLDNLRKRMKVNAKVDADPADAVRNRVRDDWSDK